MRTAMNWKTAAAALGLLAGAAQAAPLNAAGEGRRLFLELNCYGCHGMYAGGGMAKSIAHAEKGDVREAVLEGEDGGMPSFRRYVKDKDIKHLQAYLQSIGSAKEPKFMDWWEDIPPK
ncbi:MAG: cytochrome c [Burkholderiaceae bacterium]